MNGRVKGRHSADASASFFPLFFVNGRAEMRRLHFYEWGGLRITLRRRDTKIFMNGEEMANEAYACVRDRERERRDGFHCHKGNVRPDLHKESPLSLCFSFFIYLFMHCALPPTC